MQSVTGERRRVRVRGIVQGVGFRPFVYGLALELGLAGWVLNDAAGVVADVQGRPADVDAFCRRLVTDAPPTAVVEDVDWAPLEPQPRAGFVIAASSEGDGGPVARTLPPPTSPPATRAWPRSPTRRIAATGIPSCRARPADRASRS